MSQLPKVIPRSALAMSELDDLIRRMDHQIGANRSVLQAVQKGKAHRDYRNLTFEKQTGESLI